MNKTAAMLAAVILFAALVGGTWLFATLTDEPSEPAAASMDASRDRVNAEAAPTPSEAKPHVELERWGQGLPHAGQWRHGFVVIDFDGDGNLDVVHGPARKSPTRVPQVFTGDGKGTFTPSTRYTFPPLPYDYGDVAVADFDGDGALDLALAMHLTGLAVLVRRGDAFEPYGTSIGLLGGPGKKNAPRLPLTGFSSRAIEALDWNGDGLMDLIASSDGPQPFQALSGEHARGGIVVLLGKKNGFEPVFPSSAQPSHGDSLVVAELASAEGLEILAAANVIGSRNSLYSKTDTGLALSELPGAPDKRVTRVVAALPAAPPTARVLLGGLAMGEQGLEGSLDLVRVSDPPIPEASIRLFAGEPLSAVSAIGVGDLEGDGKSEILFGDEQGTLRLLTSEGASFVEIGHVPAPSQLAGCAVYGIVFTNLDGQAGDEVVVSYAGDDGACTSAGGIELYRRAGLDSGR